MVVIWPTEERRVTQAFKGSGVHSGVDLANPLGGNVRAMHDGVVVSVGSHRKVGQPASEGVVGAPGKSGNWVKIRRPNGRIDYDNHTMPAVAAGDRVTAGDIIGHTDISGITRGPHLHTEMWLRDDYTTCYDPMDELSGAQTWEDDMQLLDKFPIPQWVRNKAGIDDKDMTIQRALMYAVIAGNTSVTDAVSVAVKEALADVDSADADKIAEAVMKRLGAALS